MKTNYPLNLLIIVVSIVITSLALLLALLIANVDEYSKTHINGIGDLKRRAYYNTYDPFYHYSTYIYEKETNTILENINFKTEQSIPTTTPTKPIVQAVPNVSTSNLPSVTTVAIIGLVIISICIIVIISLIIVIKNMKKKSISTKDEFGNGSIRIKLNNNNNENNNINNEISNNNNGSNNNNNNHNNLNQNIMVDSNDNNSLSDHYDINNISFNNNNLNEKHGSFNIQIPSPPYGNRNMSINSNNNNELPIYSESTIEESTIEENEPPPEYTEINKI